MRVTKRLPSKSLTLFFLCVILCVVLSMTVLNTRFYNVLRNIVIEYTQSNATQYYKDIESTLDISRRLAAQISVDETVTAFFDKKNTLLTTELQKISKAIYQYQNFDGTIKNIILVDLERNLVLSGKSYAIFTTESYTRSYDINFAEFSQKENSLNLFTNTDRYGIRSYCYVFHPYQNDEHMIVIEYFEKKFSSNQNSESDAFAILDKEGNIIASTDASYWGMCLKGTPLWSAICQQKAETDAYFYSDQGFEMLAAYYIQPNAIGISWVNYQTIRSQVMQSFASTMFLVVIVGLCILASIFLVGYFVQKKFNAAIKEKELAEVNLWSVQQYQNNFLMKNILYNLDKDAGEGNEKLLKKIDFNVNPKNSIYAIAFDICGREQVKRIWKGDEYNTLCFAMRNVISEIMGKYLTFDIFEMADTSTIVLIDCFDEEQVGAICRSIIEQIRTHLNIDIFCAINDKKYAFSDVVTAISETLLLEKEHYLQENVSVIRNRERIVEISYSKQQLAELVKKHAFGKVCAIVQDAQKNVCMLELKSAEAFVRDVNELLGLFVQDTEETEDILKETTIEQIYTAEFFSQWADLVCAFLHYQEKVAAESEKNRYNSFAQKVMQFIEHNISNSELSVELIAQEMGMTSAYVNKLFKKCTGTNLSREIVRKRMELAKELLLHTDKKISQISSECGYMSDTYFIYAFRKHMGVTPNNYRKATDVLQDT